MTKQQIIDKAVELTFALQYPKLHEECYNGKAEPCDTCIMHQIMNSRLYALENAIKAILIPVK